MNKDNARDFLPLVNALAKGKTIQILNSLGEWSDVPAPTFQSAPSRYRVKPEPQVLWALFDSHNYLRCTFLEESEAVKCIGYGEGTRVVKFVESKD